MTLLLALASVALLAGAFAPAARASFGVEEHNFEAVTCVTSSCMYAGIEADHAEAYTQAAGHPPVGVTTFEFNHKKALLGEEPEGNVKNIRVDLPPGLAANPEALSRCPISAFEKNECKAATQAGTNELTVYDDGANLTIPGTVYNLEQPPGLPLDFGIDVSVEPLVNVHIYLEGHVSWNTDYHEYFEIDNVPKEGVVAGVKVPLAVLKSKLIFNGRAGEGDFLTLPSVCSNSTTSHLRVESYEGQVSETNTTTPVGVEGCDKVPFAPTATVTPAAGESGSDQPDGATTEVNASQYAGPEEINTADIQDAHVTLPEGMTLNPSAARGLGVCTAGQIGIGTTNPVTCPASSNVGTVTIETDLPPHSLTGNVYLGSPGGGPDHRTPVHDLPRRRERVRRLGQAPGARQAQSDYGETGSDVLGKPPAALQSPDLDTQGWCAGAARESSGLWNDPGRSPLHALHRRACAPERDAVHEQRMPQPPTVLLGSGHAELLVCGRRSYLLYIRSGSWRW